MYYSVFAEVAKFPGFLWSCTQCTVYGRGSLFIFYNKFAKIKNWQMGTNKKSKSNKYFGLKQVVIGFKKCVILCSLKTVHLQNAPKTG